VASSSIPQGVACADCLSWKVVGILKTLPKKVGVWTDSWREKLFEFPHESARLETLHFHGEKKHVKIRLVARQR
jgi:hypothetical protein